MLHLLTAAAAINPDAARGLTDHLLDLAEEAQFDAQHDAAYDNDPGAAAYHRPRLDAAALHVNALRQLDHRPERELNDQVLAERAATGCPDAAWEISLRAAGARKHVFGDASHQRLLTQIRARNAHLPAADLPF